MSNSAASTQPEASSSKTPYSSSSSSSSLRDTTQPPRSATSEPSLVRDVDQRSEDDHPDLLLPQRAMTLREPPAPDLLPVTRPTLTQFRQAEGPLIRAGKLKALWEALPTLPEYQEGPTPTKRMQLPGQDTTTALSPERADRLRNLYLEELVRECNDRRPNALLWGGSDDWKPETTKGVPWEDFR